MGVNTSLFRRGRASVGIDGAEAEAPDVWYVAGSPLRPLPPNLLVRAIRVTLKAKTTCKRTRGVQNVVPGLARWNHDWVLRRVRLRRVHVW